MRPPAQTQPLRAMLSSPSSWGHPRPKAFGAHCTQSSSEPPCSSEPCTNTGEQPPCCLQLPLRTRGRGARKEPFTHVNFSKLHLQPRQLQNIQNLKASFSQRHGLALFAHEHAWLPTLRCFPPSKHTLRVPRAPEGAPSSVPWGLTERQPHSLHPSTSCGGLTPMGVQTATVQGT